MSICENDDSATSHSAIRLVELAQAKGGNPKVMFDQQAWSQHLAFALQSAGLGKVAHALL